MRRWSIAWRVLGGNGAWVPALLLLVLVVLLVRTGPLRAADSTVCASGCDHTSVQAAIDAAAPNDVIVLAEEVFVETITVDRDLTIRGASSTTSVIDGGAAGTVVTVTTDASLTLEALTIRNGSTDENGGGIHNAGTLIGRDIVISGNAATRVAWSAGGGIYSTGALTLTDVTVTGNESHIGGGGIYVSGSTASALIERTELIGNRVLDLTTDFRGGGGIHVSLGDATVRATRIVENTTDYTGGGVTVRGSGAHVEIINTTISGNVSHYGAGIRAQSSAQLFIDGSTVSNNTAVGDNSVGGGLRASAPVTIRNSTFSGNAATGSGGAISAESIVTLDSVTIAGNQAGFGGGIGSFAAGTTLVTNSILAANSATNSGNDCAGSIDGGSALIIADGTDCDLTAVASVLVADPLLGPLADHGGPTLTRAPAPESPAIDAGMTSLTVDQRGEPRPAGEGPDVGSVELQEAPPAPVLAAPADVVAEGLSISQIQLTWTDTSTGADGFEIQRHDGTDFVRIDLLPPDATSYVDDGLEPDTTHLYRLRSFVGTTQFSPFSDPVAGTTLAIVIEPPPAVFDPPSDLIARAAGHDRINLSWQDNSILEEGFALEWSPNGSLFFPIALLDPPLPRNTACWVHTGRSPDSTYHYRVRAFDADGNVTDWSNVATDTTGPVPEPAPAPDEPVLVGPDDLFACASGELTVELNWSDTAQGEDAWRVRCYIVDEDRSCSPSRTPELPPDTTSFRVTGLSADTRYEFAVRPVTGIGFSAEDPPYTDPPVEVRTFPIVPPHDFRITEVTADHVAVAWTDTAFDEEGWLVARENASRTSFLPGPDGLPPNTESYVDDDHAVRPGRTFFYSAQAHPFFPEGRSNRVAATIPIAELTVIPLSTYSDGRVILDWPSIVPYSFGDEPHVVQIERSTDGTTYDRIAELDPENDPSTYDDASLDPGPYHYRIRVFNDTLPGGPYASTWTEASATVPERAGVCADGSTTDSDGDHLPDCWEIDGYDHDGDGIIDIDLPALGTDPQRKDLFVEIDCFVDDGNDDGDLDDLGDHAHCPVQAAMELVADAFAEAPVPNPDGTTGIQLHLDTGDQFGDGVVFQRPGSGGVVSTFGDLGGGGDEIDEAGLAPIYYREDTPATFGVVDPPGTVTIFYDLKASHFDALRAQIFRYAISAHQTAARQLVNDCTSGSAEGIPGNDFFVTLGGWRNLQGGVIDDIPCWTPTAANGIDDDGDGLIDEDPWNGVDDDGDCPGDTNMDGVICNRGDLGVDEDSGWSIGSVEQQAGTFMHELGHTLGLKHGGDDHRPPYKQNYLSVMNYFFQQCRVPSSPDGGLPGGCDFSRIVLPDLLESDLDECAGIDGPDHVLGFGPINWNRSESGGEALFEGATCLAPHDQNVEADIGGFNGIEAHPHTSFDDWSAIVFDFTSLATYANGIAFPIVDEPDPETIEQGERLLAEVASAVLVVEKTGPAVGHSGEVIDYTLTVRNVGAGPGYGVVLRDFLPDGSERVFEIGTIAAGAEATRTLGFTLSSLDANATVANVAEVTWSDLAADGLTADDLHETFVCADVNGDRSTTFTDLRTLTRAMASSPNDARWDPRADLNGDSVIGADDLAILLASLANADCT